MGIMIIAPIIRKIILGKDEEAEWQNLPLQEAISHGINIQNSINKTHTIYFTYEIIC